MLVALIINKEDLCQLQSKNVKDVHIDVYVKYLLAMSVQAVSIALIALFILIMKEPQKSLIVSIF